MSLGVKGLSGSFIYMNGTVLSVITVFEQLHSSSVDKRVI
jgi:hypothetical protein